jgi:uncharacterized cupredoxin-like copper-binding protein
MGLVRVLAGLVASGVALFVAGCGGDEAAAVEPVEVRGDEYAFVMPSEGEAGVVRFDISNAGKELHEFALGRLAEGKTIADVKAYLASGQEDAPEWFTDVGGVPLLSPGEQLGLTRELEAGTYVFLCFIPSPQGVPHVALGMLKSFELSGDSKAELPEPDAVIVANNGGFEVPELSAGEQTIELRNADDTEREFFLIALKPGKTQDLERFFEAGEGKGEPPARFHGAMQTIPAGTSVFVDVNLQAGVEYTLADNSGDQPFVTTFTPG